MTQHWVGGLRELEEWLRDGVSAAQRALPDLLDLPPAVLKRELAGRAELHTAGMIQVLIDLARDAHERYPNRAHELTSIAVELSPIPHRFPDREVVTTRVRALAWREHARALGALNRPDDARAALAKSRTLIEQTPAHHWYSATIDLLEAPMAHDSGDRALALELVRRAAGEFAVHHDYEHLVEARMLEMWMHWAAGDDVAASDTWTRTAELAELRRHPTLLARLSRKAAQLHLRRGEAEAATRLLEEALSIFDREGLDADALRTRWHLAEALTARGRIHEAISEFHKLRAMSLAAGRIHDAAIASAEIVELLLVTGREEEIPAFTESLLDTFHSRLTQNALEALTFLAARAAAATLTREDVAAVRRFFEDLRQRPHAWFRGAE